MSISPNLSNLEGGGGRGGEGREETTWNYDIIYTLCYKHTHTHTHIYVRKTQPPFPQMHLTFRALEYAYYFWASFLKSNCVLTLE